MMQTQWSGKKVAFLGDSITDKCHVGTEKNYWQYLQESLGIEPLVYGINGNNWTHIPEQAEKLIVEHKTDVDAIFVFVGTNDYMSNVPLGQWYNYHMQETNYNGNHTMRLRRLHNLDRETLCGRINAAMSFLKETFVDQQIILATPIHRAFASFSDTNIQPDESFPNSLGLYLDDYVKIIREAADIWSCPLVDIYRISGLHPLTESHGKFFHKEDTDRLHPGTAGHRRMAEAIRYQLLAMPSTFR